MAALLDNQAASAASLAAKACRQPGSEARASYQREISPKRFTGSAMRCAAGNSPPMEKVELVTTTEINRHEFAFEVEIILERYNAEHP